MHVLLFTISIILESVLFLLYFVFLPVMVENTSVMSLNICMMPQLPNMQGQKVLTHC